MQKAEPGMGFITSTAQFLLAAQIWMYGNDLTFVTSCKVLKFQQD